MKHFRLPILAVFFLSIIATVSYLRPGRSMAAKTSYPFYPAVLRCQGLGSGHLDASTHGIRFKVNQPFIQIALRMAETSSTRATYTFDAELRRGTDYSGPADYTVPGAAYLPPNGAGSYPYERVIIDFGQEIPVTGSETFTLKFANIVGSGSLFFESRESSPLCPAAAATNLAGTPAIQGDPAGLTIMRGSWSRGLQATEVQSPPLIDGRVDPGEWLGQRFDFGAGFVSLSNDEFRLYVLVDLLDDPQNTATERLGLTFDIDENYAITPGLDRQYLVFGDGELRYRVCDNSDTCTGNLQPTVYSSRARSYGCSEADGSLVFETSGSTQIPHCAKHVVWELAIDLEEIKGGSHWFTRLGLFGNSDTPAIEYEAPVEPRQFWDFSQLLEIALDPVRKGYTLNSSAHISLEAYPVEITQAIQRPNNAVEQVADKDSIMRVYFDLTGAAEPQPVKVFLYGTRGGASLPGSPLAVRYFTKPVMRRDRLDGAANIRLPASWVEPGATVFSVRSVDYYGFVDTWNDMAVTFFENEVPTYWIVRINRSSFDPIVVDNAEVVRQQSAMEAVWPVAKIDWVLKPWQSLGAVRWPEEPIDALNDYYDATLTAWSTAVNAASVEPYALPDQIYGFLTSGGGRSDPTWASGQGRVANGFRGSSLELTMAHELMHNQDRSRNGTWGRHVSNPADADDPAWGCGAAGPDPMWEPENDNIQEVGFDTRTPWVDTAAQDTVVPANFPDFMSYCQSDDLAGVDENHLPTKWIAPYHWSALVDHFAASSSSPTEFVRSGTRAAEVLDVYYFSGVVRQNGTGALNPFLTQPGLAMGDDPAGTYAIEVQDAAGSPTSTTHFTVSFVDQEGVEHQEVSFRLKVPVTDGAAKVVLKQGDTMLDTIGASDNPPTVTVDEGFGSGSTAEKGTLTWTAGDLDGDMLSFSVLYTPDDGQSWYPSISGITTTQVTVDTAALPGGDGARFRVLATDGFYSAQDDQDQTFSMIDHVPEVYITSPYTNTTVLGETVMQFSGIAQDLEDGALPAESLIWQINGQPVATGPKMSAWLPLGIHHVKLIGQDSAGYAGEATVQVVVVTRVMLPLIIRN